MRLKLMEHPDYALAVPTPDHLVPLYTAGLAAEAGVPMEPLLRGYAMGGISMTCFGLDVPVELRRNPHHAAGLPAEVPADQTNT